MTPELKSLIDQWTSFPSKFINRSNNLFTNENGDESIDFICEYIGEPNFKEVCRIDTNALDADICTCTKTLYKFWESFNNNLIPHLDTHWISIEKEAPIPYENLDLAIITPLGDPITNEFSSEIHFSEGLFNGSYFQIKDKKAASDVNTRKADILLWRNI